MAWLWPLLVLVMAGIVALSVNAYRVSTQLDAAQSAQTDNNTWLVTQLEVEVLKLNSAVLAASAEEAQPAAFRRLRTAFDVYLSRLNVISGHLARPGPLQGQRLNADWLLVMSLTEEIDRAMTLPDASLQATLPTLGDELAQMRSASRRFAVGSLGILVAENAAQRDQLRELLTRFAVISLCLIVVLVLASGLMLRFAGQLRLRGRRAERMRSNLEKTLAASLDGVIRCASDGRILQANPAVETIFGHGPGDPLVGNIRDLLADAAAGHGEAAGFRAYLQGDLRDEPPAGRGVVTGRRRDGTPFPAEVALAADQDAEGRRVIFAFIRDISEQRRFETNLRNARDEALAAAEAKSRFLAVMSHEMRTPLNGTIAALELMERTTRLDPRQARFLEIADAGAQAALEQINDVLELARLESGPAETEASQFHLARCIREVAEQLAPLARRQDNLILLDLPAPCEIWVAGPRRLLSNTLTNLLGNAVKFTHGGQIRIGARLDPQADGGLSLRIVVEDTGIGIAAEKLGRIFEPFEMLDNGYDRAVEGTGLGLGIARLAVEQMGGQIGVDSTPGKGSAFWFTARLRPVLEPGLPRAETRAVGTVAGPSLSQDVLIAEDNPTNRLVLREMLEYLGQRVTEATNGAEAVDLAQGKAFDLILMDISMPVLDGLAASREIRAAGASQGARIVGLTAHGLPDELRRFAQAGLAEVIRKPITFAALGDLLQVPVAACRSEIDAPALQDLRRILSGEARRAAVQAFLAEGDGFLAALGDPAVADAELATLAHRLHGAVAQFGGKSLTRGLQRLEMRLRDGQGRAEGGDQAPGALQLSLTAEWRSLAAEVRRVLAD